MSSPDRTRRPIRGVAAGLGLGLVVTGLTGLSAAPAHAADPVELQLLNINDFHGRIDANTTKFATTVENLRAGNPNTLFLSAGDNIGASLFASNIQQDAPTIDVLNALGLQTSAVGNHEFDKGAADLNGRVKDRADWTYLGANVYTKGTTTPALPEYASFTVGGVDVAVIGVVTEETTSAVSPAGIANLDFGDPVEAVNRVAGQLTDGDAANGEADVIVAEYHEGADGGQPGSTLADEVAKGGAFADIVEETSPAVDAIFTGHTHSAYAWDAPVPGSSATRPIVQTGSYGANIGQIELTYDPDTDTVTTYAAANVARVATANESLPRVAAVKTIVDAALAEATKIGNRVVGRQSGDITTAYSGGAYTGPGGTYTGGTRDDRASESTLGNLVAEALLAGAKSAEPDFAVTNPGGLRAELLAAGDTSSNPANTDGVITLAEAAAVTPFANTLSTVKMTGEQIYTLFEQQYPSADRTTQLQLATSDNLRITSDPAAAAGDRITSIRLDGVLLDPAETYTVATLTFLAAGGDSFSAFTQGTATDIGFLDLDVFTDHLTQNSPVAPDYARQQVDVTGTLPATVSAGDQVDVDLARLDLTSQGSPANTFVKAFAVSGTTTRELGTFPVSGGAASVELTVPADLAGEQGLSLIAEPSRTVIGAALPKLRSTTTATFPTSSVYGRELVVPVTVSSALAPGGRVRLMAGDTLVRRADLVDGKTTFRLGGRVLKPGYHRLSVVYVGDGTVATSSSPVTRVGIAKAVPRKVVVNVKQQRIVARRTVPRIVVRVRPPVGIDVALSGTVRIKVGHRVARVPLINGRAIWRMAPFATPGRKPITATFIGSGNLKSATGKVVVRVKRR